MDDIDNRILDALKHPQDQAPLDAIVAIGQPAYDRLVSRMYARPGSSHPQDIDDRMTVLVGRIARLDPAIITNNIQHKDPRARSRVLNAAAATDDPEFADIMIERLNDRSIYVVDNVLWLIENRDYLKTARAASLLRRLLKSKRVDRLMQSREEIAELANRIESNLPNNTSEGTSKKGILGSGRE